MSQPNQQDTDLEMVRQAAHALSEHFDSVQIFCNRHEAADGGTINISYGQGNLFARYGQVAVWLAKEDETGRMERRTEPE